MKIRPFVCLLCALCATTVFAAPPLSDIPMRSRSGGKPDPGSLDVFRAFHTQSGPVEVRQSAPAPVRNVPAIFPLEFRSIDGSGNNAANPLLGAAITPVLRLTTVGYGDGVGSPAGADRLSPREISNLVAAETGLIPNTQNISSFVWQWGQFIDHDMGLSRVANPAEKFDIPVPQGDPQFDPRGTGTKVLPFQRSDSLMINGIREQVNVNTSFIDASQVYGSRVQLANELRTNDGTGHLKTSDNNLLPFNVDGFPNQPDPSTTFFLAGDVRANENPGLTSLQTLFMREHNFWADTIKNGNPTFNDNDIYFRARAIVGAEIQLITYRDLLPILLGPNALAPYAGYNSDIDPSTSNEFSTAAFRVGHTFLPPVFMQLDSRNRSFGDVGLGQTFFNPKATTNRGIEPFVRGLAKQIPQQVDPYIIDAVRNFLVGGLPGKGGFDLASLNIQRGRDHGLPGYNQVRIDFGLAPKATFADMTSDPDLQAKLASAYTSPDDVDLWVGGLSETHLDGAQVGETFFTIIKDQFTRTRDGDRFWYESYLDPDTLATVQAQTLSIIIKRNAKISKELQDDAFQVPTN